MVPLKKKKKKKKKIFILSDWMLVDFNTMSVQYVSSTYDTVLILEPSNLYIKLPQMFNCA